MTAYAGDIDQTEGSANGTKFTAIAGSGGVTAGDPIKYDGSTAKTVITSTTTTDIIIGIARDTAAEGAAVTVLSNGCKVKVPFTLTVGAAVGVGTGGTAGDLVDYSAGTYVGVVETSATLASVIRVQISYKAA